MEPTLSRASSYFRCCSFSVSDSRERSLHRCLYDELLLQCGIEGFPLLAVQAAEPLYRPAVERWCFTDDRFSAPLWQCQWRIYHSVGGGGRPPHRYKMPPLLLNCRPPSHYDVHINTRRVTVFPHSGDVIHSQLSGIVSAI